MGNIQNYILTLIKECKCDTIDLDEWLTKNYSEKPAFTRTGRGGETRVISDSYIERMFMLEEIWSYLSRAVNHG
jgi:hypothetical protein